MRFAKSIGQLFPGLERDRQEARMDREISTGSSGVSPKTQRFSDDNRTAVLGIMCRMADAMSRMEALASSLEAELGVQEMAQRFTPHGAQVMQEAAADLEQLKARHEARMQAATGGAGVDAEQLKTTEKEDNARIDTRLLRDMADRYSSLSSRWREFHTKLGAANMHDDDPRVAPLVSVYGELEQSRRQAQRVMAQQTRGAQAR